MQWAPAGEVSEWVRHALQTALLSTYSLWKYLDCWKWRGSFPQESHPPRISLAKSSMHRGSLLGTYSSTRSNMKTTCSRLVSIALKEKKKKKENGPAISARIWITFNWGLPGVIPRDTHNNFFFMSIIIFWEIFKVLGLQYTKILGTSKVG